MRFGRVLYSGDEENMNDLISLNSQELKELVTGMGEKPFAAKQLEDWLTRGVKFEDMSNLSKALRERLRREHDEGYARIVEKLTSSDGTAKYLLAMSGGGLVECVLMRYHHGNTLCVSTQVGCRMGCAFCASGREGLIRNLSCERSGRNIQRCFDGYRRASRQLRQRDMLHTGAGGKARNKHKTYIAVYMRDRAGHIEAGRRRAAVNALHIAALGH